MRAGRRGIQHRLRLAHPAERCPGRPARLGQCRLVEPGKRAQQTMSIPVDLAGRSKMYRQGTLKPSLVHYEYLFPVFLSLL
ncbi:hypothetical protein NDU88_006207 [Pleurodeles waltl]|uniref:Uncharacterized protein n=1 Tax=Pleurodeles waltl TaxID=8319 RepID=A0AAV7RR79_PLEWA|nr:hypothetical protein NDU88_006207 [Pleurodeles waltl]